MFGIDDAFVMVMSHEIGPKSFSFIARGARVPGPLGLAVERSRSRPAMMVSLNVEAAADAGRRLCSRA